MEKYNRLVIIFLSADEKKELKSGTLLADCRRGKCNRGFKDDVTKQEIKMADAKAKYFKVNLMCRHP